MNRPTLVRSLAEMSAEITKELDSLADRAFELQRRAEILRVKEDTLLCDKGSQTTDAAVGVPSFKLQRVKRLQPFTYLPFNRRLDWKKIRNMNLDRMARESDSRALMELYRDVSQADLVGESSYNLTEANMVKLVRVCQMMLQFVQYSSEQQYTVQQLLEEDNAEMQANLKLIPDMGLEAISDGLYHLEQDFYQVADADMDAMFQQVRVEERTGARDLLGGLVDQAKKDLQHKIDDLDNKPLAPPSASGAAAGGGMGMGATATAAPPEGLRLGAAGMRDQGSSGGGVRGGAEGPDVAPSRAAAPAPPAPRPATGTGSLPPAAGSTPSVQLTPQQHQQQQQQLQLPLMRAGSATSGGGGRSRLSRASSATSGQPDATGASERPPAKG